MTKRKAQTHESYERNPRVMDNKHIPPSVLFWKSKHEAKLASLRAQNIWVKSCMKSRNLCNIALFTLLLNSCLINISRQEKCLILKTILLQSYFLSSQAATENQSPVSAFSPLVIVTSTYNKDVIFFIQNYRLKNSTL